MLNDVSGAVSIHEFEKMGASGVFDPARVACVVDHFWPAKDARSAALVARLRTFAERQGITDYWEVGATRDAGIEHAILAERGRIMPGDLLVGADSHTCTSGAFAAFATGMGSSDIAAAMALGEVWLKVPEVIEVEFTGSPGEHVTGKDLILAYIAQAGVDGANYAALEFCGEAVDALSLDGRLALCNMAVEAGAKTGMVAADETTLAVARRARAGGRPRRAGRRSRRALRPADEHRPRRHASAGRRPPPPATSIRSTSSRARSRSTRSTSGTARTGR